jgi:hypothetical protein
MSHAFTITLSMDDPHLELRVEGSATPYDPGVSSGPVEVCYAPEGGEVDIEGVWLTGTDAPDIEVTPLITLLGAWDKLQELTEQAFDNLPAQEPDYPEPDEDYIP